MNNHIETHKYSFRMESNTKTLVRINLTHVLLNFSNFIYGQLQKVSSQQTLKFSYQVYYKNFFSLVWLNQNISYTLDSQI